MAFKKSESISYEVKEDGIKEIIDENNNMAIIMQEVSWNGRQAHLEIRKWIIDETGQKPHKGFSFMTEQGPNNLTKALLKNGYGNTEEVINIIKSREDFADSLVNAIGKQRVIKAKETEVEISEEDYFDPAKMFA